MTEVAESVTDVLVARGLASTEQVAAAQASARTTGETVVNTLVQAGIVSKKDVVKATVQAAGLEFVEILDVEVDPQATILLTGDQARKYHVIPLRLEHDSVVIVADSQTAGSWQVRNDLQAITRKPVVFACAMKSEIATRLNQVYRAEAELGELVKGIMEEERVVDILAPVAATSDAPLIRYVNLLLNQAISDNASDIHVEPTEDYIRVRFRIDGVLKEMSPVPKEMQSALISRLKIMSEMNIAERRLPQDGRLTIQWSGRKVDLRVSCLPTVWGEKIVMRILDNTAAQLALTDLGFSALNLTRWHSAYSRPYGMLIVSGPTGSGKSTSLYATLRAVSRPEVNIVTVEDPVEYRIPGVNQIQVHSKAGLTFASALRSILRADPDVILIGEIRDHETAQIAIESALTGHLVLTTLHTNDAPSVITRLTEMGIEPFLVNSALECASGQRLARRLCPKCRRRAEPSADELAGLGFEVPAGVEISIHEPVGCSSCAGTGYRGRIGLHEVMMMSEAIGGLSVRRAASDEIRGQAICEGMRTLKQDGWLKVAQGLTTVSEVLRVIV